MPTPGRLGGDSMLGAQHLDQAADRAPLARIPADLTGTARRFRGCTDHRRKTRGEFRRRRLGIENELTTDAADREEVIAGIECHERPIQLINQSQPAFAASHRTPGPRHARHQSTRYGTYLAFNIFFHKWKIRRRSRLSVAIHRPRSSILAPYV